MEEKKKRVSRWWRTTTVLTLGVVIGTVLMATPAGSHIGTVSHLWNRHIKPRADARYERPKIQPGQTVRGTIGHHSDTAGAGIEVASNQSLPRAAPFGLDDEHITVDGSTEDTSKCNGTVAAPTATAGWVCIYPYYSENVQADSEEGYIWGSAAESPDVVKWGFQFSWFSDLAGPTAMFATWAYKAPASAPARPVARTGQCDGGGGC
jgi:hypothetical protein